jgi:hypothetical protein
MGGALSTGRSRIAGGAVVAAVAVIAMVLRSRARQRREAEKLEEFKRMNADMQAGGDGFGGDYRKSEDYRRRNATQRG